jgi:hypothetical protein
MDFVVKVKSGSDMIMSIDAPFINWLNQFQSVNCSIEIDPYCNEVLYDNKQLQLLSKIEDMLRSFRDQRIQYYRGNGNKLPADPVLRESLLQQLIKKDFQANPNFIMLEDFQALIEIALESDSLIYCFSD